MLADDDKARGRVLKLVSMIQECAEEALGLMGTPTVKSFKEASPEASQFMVGHYMEHSRWPSWWECFEAGRKLGGSHGGTVGK